MYEVRKGNFGHQEKKKKNRPLDRHHRWVAKSSSPAQWQLRSIRGLGYRTVLRLGTRGQTVSASWRLGCMGCWHAGGLLFVGWDGSGIIMLLRRSRRQGYRKYNYENVEAPLCRVEAKQKRKLLLCLSLMEFRYKPCWLLARFTSLYIYTHIRIHSQARRKISPVTPSAFFVTFHRVLTLRYFAITPKFKWISAGAASSAEKRRGRGITVSEVKLEIR